MKALSVQEELAANFLSVIWQKHGRTATYTELTEALRLSRGNAYGLVRKLQAKGVEHTPQQRDASDIDKIREEIAREVLEEEWRKLRRMARQL